MPDRTAGNALRSKPPSGLRRAALATALVSFFCLGCTSAPEQSGDVDSYSPKVYRTGSNLPVKDYDGANIDQRGPEAINPVNRPMGFPRPRSGF
jgi:hypothetical protein